jgi:toxin-antitoxin system PIN domain toxin
VILIDANLLLYATNEAFPQHRRAKTWLDERLAGSARVGLPWPSLLAFLRLATNARMFARPMRTHEAWRQVKTWLECEHAWTPGPTERHAEVLGRLLAEPGVNGSLVHDAHLAALAIEHGLELCSNDGDFARFPDLRWSNPLRA